MCKMLFYKITVKIHENENIPDSKNREEYEEYASSFPAVNEQFYQKNNKQNYFFIASIKNHIAIIGAIVKDNNSIEKAIKKYLTFVSLTADVSNIEEITVRSLVFLLNMGDRNYFVSSSGGVLEDLGLIFFERHRRCDVKYTEELLTRVTDKETIIKNLRESLFEDSLLPEIERIYMGKGSGNTKSHPVHYMIKTDNPKSVSTVYHNLICALYNNKRIFNKRYCCLSFDNNTELYDNSLEAIYKTCEGGALVVQFSGIEEKTGSFARFGKKTIIEVCAMMEKYKNTVLSILCLPAESEKIKSIFTENLNNVSFVEISEDLVSGDKAKAYLKTLARRNNISVDKKLFSKLKEDTFYTESNLAAMFDDWFCEKLKTSVYPQYKDVTNVKSINLKSAPRGNAVEELNRLVGLDNAKKVITQALNFYKVQKIYADKGVRADRPAMHMVFTGNPGTAKTTVARLFAQIMKDNGILSNGDLYEVGRADIVGQFVGQTAPLVKTMFKKAKGSVLFIDEAYSLVDDRDGLYGDEAINTIVQEMENNREDTVVIFAGYPDKMEGFLNKNPGLRSRIAFNIPFDDYNEEELLEIAELTAQKAKMKFTDDAKEKMRKLFSENRKCADFGNGRFVRNMFEKAKMAQANRLVNMNYDDVTSDILSTLTASDIVIPEKVKYQPVCKIGF